MAIVVVCLDCFNEFRQIGTIGVIDLRETESGASLAMNETTETRFALDDAVGDAHLATECWEEENHLQKRKFMKFTENSINLRGKNTKKVRMSCVNSIFGRFLLKKIPIQVKKFFTSFESR